MSQYIFLIASVTSRNKFNYDEFFERLFWKPLSQTVTVVTQSSPATITANYSSANGEVTC
jgi:hypothetical protein